MPDAERKKARAEYTTLATPDRRWSWSRSNVPDGGSAGEKPPAVVDPKRVCRVREEAQLHSWAHLMLVAGERGVMVVKSHARTQLPFVRGCDRGLRVYADVAALEVRGRGGPGVARGGDRRKVLVPPGQRR